MARRRSSRHCVGCGTRIVASTISKCWTCDVVTENRDKEDKDEATGRRGFPSFTSGDGRRAADETGRADEMQANRVPRVSPTKHGPGTTTRREKPYICVELAPRRAKVHSPESRCSIRGLRRASYYGGEWAETKPVSRRRIRYAVLSTKYRALDRNQLPMGRPMAALAAGGTVGRPADRPLPSHWRGVFVRG